LINVNSIPITPIKTTTILDIANIYETLIIRYGAECAAAISPLVLSQEIKK
jgi:hypothetical protein